MFGRGTLDARAADAPPVAVPLALVRNRSSDARSLYASSILRSRRRVTDEGGSSHEPPVSDLKSLPTLAEHNRGGGVAFTDRDSSAVDRAVAV